MELQHVKWPHEIIRVDQQPSAFALASQLSKSNSHVDHERGMLCFEEDFVGHLNVDKPDESKNYTFTFITNFFMFPSPIIGA